MKILSWLFALSSAGLLVLTTFCKFTAAPKAVYVFTSVGVEPWGRYGFGTTQVVAAVLILLPATRILGALLGLGVILGAIFFHVTKLGIEVQGDGGQLLGLALALLASCAGLLAIHRGQLAQIALNLRGGPEADGKCAGPTR
jgi:hypothetical protein